MLTLRLLATGTVVLLTLSANMMSDLLLDPLQDITLLRCLRCLLVVSKTTFLNNRRKEWDCNHSNQKDERHDRDVHSLRVGGLGRERSWLPCIVIRSSILIYIILTFICAVLCLTPTSLLLDELLPLSLMFSQHLPSLQIICLLGHFVTDCHYSAEINQQVECQENHGEDDLKLPLFKHGIINDLKNQDW